MNKAAAVAALAVFLGACASTPRQPPPLAGATARMLDSAQAMLGQPYRYGGAAPGGFDCSGLVVFAAHGAGIHVPRTAKEQENIGARVARADVQAGDLVFLRLVRKELHVGIALDHARFIHAPSSGGRVRIDSLTAAPYAQGFITARRIIDAE